jgi:hypothetical protein
MSPSASSVSFKEALLTFLLILLMATVGLSHLVPPTVVPASAPVTHFSAERAMKHLKVIACEPHPTGSIANGRVRGYIVEQMQSLGRHQDLAGFGGILEGSHLSEGRLNCSAWVRISLSRFSHSEPSLLDLVMIVDRSRGIAQTQ